MALIYRLTITQPAITAFTNQPRWAALKELTKPPYALCMGPTTTTEILFTDGAEALAAYEAAKKARKPGEMISLSSNSLIASEG